jgi:hypothetical protein
VVKRAVYILIILLSLYEGVSAQDSLVSKPHRSCVFRTYPPQSDAAGNVVLLRNQKAPFGRKFLRATGFVFALEATEMTILINSNSDFSKWERWELGNLSAHYKAAYTQPPIIDKDDWFTNYVEHPYGGAFNYNMLRSQGAPIWQSFLFTTLHSTLWEYVIEASEERPSIQDLIVTPIGGALFGELAHFATMRMCRNGLTWYETIVVIIIDPAFIINNGFKFTKRYPRHLSLRHQDH